MTLGERDQSNASEARPLLLGSYSDSELDVVDSRRLDEIPHNNINNSNNNHNNNNNKGRNSSTNHKKNSSSSATGAGAKVKSKGVPDFAEVTIERRVPRKPFTNTSRKAWLSSFSLHDQWRWQRGRGWSCTMLKRKYVITFLGLILLILYVNSSLVRNRNDDRIPVLHHSHVPGMKGYLVWSERCKMPNIDPYQPDVMKFFERQKYVPCSTQESLTRVDFDAASRRYVLHIVKERVGSFSPSGSLDCCYQAILRNGTGKAADSYVSLASCVGFSDGTPLEPTIDSILVKCRTKGKQVYINGHAMMPEREEVRERSDEWKAKDAMSGRKATSVLMIGIDSTSRINLIRAMPKTAQYLYDNEWFEMSGYNKIDDNTFPNLMAVLTGRNKTNAFKKCTPTVVSGLDDCPFIWKTFRDHGYVTAYAEDEASINTFNYLKLGFERPPVDYYLRPFMLTAEKHLPIRRKSGHVHCIGYKNPIEMIYDYALDMATRFKDDPYFGFFWTNTFSHDAISDSSAIDERMVYYFKKLVELGTMNDTIVIFLSDHGLRFGPTRKTLSGHLEERLPLLFFWLPPHLKDSHPEFLNALSVNKNRLTNPYDLHMTLKHVLALSGRVADQKLLAQAEDCARCQTLLAPVQHNRSCEDVAIEDHWCTCIPYQSVFKNSNIVHKMAKFSVNYINDFLATFQNGSFAKICKPLTLSNIDLAFRAQLPTNNGGEVYRVNFYTKPNQALYEATVRWDATTKDFQVTGEISRLNSYAGDSDCVADGGAKKYCSCYSKKIW